MANPEIPPPASWFVYPLHSDRFAIGDYSPKGVCRVVADFSPRACITGAGDETPSDAECMAWARLASAAPRLLAALRTLCDVAVAMDADNDGEKPTEADYQAALTDANCAIASATEATS